MLHTDALPEEAQGPPAEVPLTTHGPDGARRELPLWQTLVWHRRADARRALGLAEPTGASRTHDAGREPSADRVPDFGAVDLLAVLHDRPRTRNRAARLIWTKWTHAEPDAAPPEEAALAPTDRALVLHLARHGPRAAERWRLWAGAAGAGRDMRRLVRSADVAVLIQALGRDAHRFGVAQAWDATPRHAPRDGMRTVRENDASVDLETVLRTVAAEGMVRQRHWIADLPDGWSRLLRAVLEGPEPSGDAPHGADPDAAQTFRHAARAALQRQTLDEAASAARDQDAPQDGPHEEVPESQAPRAEAPADASEAGLSRDAPS